MATKKAKSFNHQIFQKAYNRLHLSPTERIILYRLLGFLIRNNKPFPYSAVKLAELTGFSLRTIFNTLNALEKYRLINRHGLGKNRRFSAGSILIKIFTTVQNAMYRNSTTVQLVHQKSTNRATGAYIKTSLSLKHKEKGFVFISDQATPEQVQNIIWHLNNLQFKMPEYLQDLTRKP
jgi:hypothetical protein